MIKTLFILALSIASFASFANNSDGEKLLAVKKKYEESSKPALISDFELFNARNPRQACLLIIDTDIRNSSRINSTFNIYSFDSSAKFADYGPLFNQPNKVSTALWMGDKVRNHHVKIGESKTDLVIVENVIYKKDSHGNTIKSVAILNARKGEDGLIYFKLIEDVNINEESIETYGYCWKN